MSIKKPVNKIEKLIDELCPEGAEWLTLHEVADIGTGSSNTNEGLSEGLYPFFGEHYLFLPYVKIYGNRNKSH